MRTISHETNYDALKLSSQLCFPLYACSKEIVRRYKPFLDAIDLTYTQYITMMVMWEHRELNIKTLGEYLFLDSGTLTPVVKRLEAKHLITKLKDETDGRGIIVAITEEGMALRERAADIPARMGACIHLEQQDAMELYRILHKLLNGMTD